MAILPFCELSLKGKAQGELDLARRPGGFADDTEAGAEQSVRRPSEIHNIENVEELRAKLQGSPCGGNAAGNGARIVERLRIGVAGLKAQAVARCSSSNCSAIRCRTSAKRTAPTGWSPTDAATRPSTGTREGVLNLSDPRTDHSNLGLEPALRSYESRSRPSGQYGVDIVQSQHPHRHASLNGRTADMRQ